MLRIDCPPLPDELNAYLDERRVHNAPWNSLRGTRAAEQIKAHLVQAFHHKCGYCETIEAQTVDHFYPQRNPEKRWIWDNYILACAVCQSMKRDQPPEDSRGNQMVNPRFDEPLAFLYFDYDTGLIVPLPTSEWTKARGRITIERLQFDSRQTLQEERRRKLWDVLGYMVRVVSPRSDADARDAWQQLVDHLQPERPYLGMIRQLILKPGKFEPLIVKLRETHPEFDRVIREWCLPLDTDSQLTG